MNILEGDAQADHVQYCSNVSAVKRNWVAAE
jgi:hypothetical protein